MHTFVNDDVIDFMLIIHFPLFWRLRVDRLKRSVDQCGRKTFYAFTNVNVYVWTGPKLALDR